MRQSRLSPTLSKLSNALKNFSVEALGEVVGQMVSSGNLEHFNTSFANMVRDKVPLNQEVLGAVGNALLGGKQQCAIVVFKDAAANARLKVRWQSQFFVDLTKKVAKWQ